MSQTPAGLVQDLALQFLFSRKAMSNTVSRLALAGLVLSLSVLVIVLSVVNGFERELRERILGLVPHVTLHLQNGMSLAQFDEMANQLAVPDNPHVSALAPVITDPVMLLGQGHVEGVNLLGVEPSSYAGVSDVGKFLTQGELAALKEIRFGLILGERLASKLNVTVGDSVVVVQPRGSYGPAGFIPRQRRFTVIDVFNSRSQLDAQVALTSLEAARRLFRLSSEVSSVQARVPDVFATSNAKQVLRQAAEESAGLSFVSDWKRSFGSLYQAIVVQKATMFILLLFLVGVAAFNLISGLFMLVEQRREEIAILASMGASGTTLVRVFALLGLSLAVVGILAGLSLGVLIAWLLPGLYTLLNGLGEGELMAQYFIAYLPVEVRGLDVLTVGLVALVLSALAILYPAWRASKMPPGRILAQETV